MFLIFYTIKNALYPINWSVNQKAKNE